MNQTQKIINHLETYGSITALEAVDLYGIMRLAPRISDAKMCGKRIKTNMISGKNRFGEPTRYARYVLEE